ncbi:MAG: stage III sporulation protein AC [Ruminococcaceae bacterium]|nr:stage III sporulation protein AC [Oscillospiraceae bacterium]
MDVGLILKIAGIGFLVTVTNMILSKAGRDEQSIFCTLAGIILVLIVLMGEIEKLISLVTSTFGL